MKMCLWRAARFVAVHLRAQWPPAEATFIRSRTHPPRSLRAFEWKIPPRVL